MRLPHSRSARRRASVGYGLVADASALGVGRRRSGGLDSAVVSGVQISSMTASVIDGPAIAHAARDAVRSEISAWCACGQPSTAAGDSTRRRRPSVVSLRQRQAKRVCRGGHQTLVGDVDIDSVVQVAGLITPVPGRVGPMTIAMLLRNTLYAAQAAAATPEPLVQV
jgi:hypothetical protein